MPTLRVLSADADLLAFKHGYEAALSTRSGDRLRCTVPMEYLRSSVVTGILDDEGALGGGYIVRHEAPFRCLGAVPEAVDPAWLTGKGPAQMCELTCIWRNDAIDASTYATRVWPRIILDCVTSRKSWILGVGFDNRMNEVYRAGGPVPVYDGPGASAELDTEVHVYAYTRTAMVVTFVRNFVQKMILRPLGLRPART